ncbi:3'-5' exonuclease, partial [Mycolicibacter kumamotonensis]|uniref:3'-5' exonuclease n=1 Tax=Mycolicibacter kumamotonensis TaxID=354243 RepID=UPI002E814B2D
GVKIAGRSARLNLNYRTTAEILAWSMGLLRGQPIDDMDGGLDSIAGCTSHVHGSAPRLEATPSADAEAKLVAAVVRDWLDGGVAPAEIGIAVRAKWFATKIEKALASAGIASVRLADASDADDDAVRIGTMHRMKGLEFRCMAVAGVSAKQVPEPNAVTPIEDDEQTHRQNLEQERCLLFVACTRAREQLLVTWHGAPSPFLAPLIAE